MEHTTIAVDPAKSVFQVAVSHRPGHLDDERRLSRDRLLPFFAQQAPTTIVLEACGSAHYWARQLQPFGHTGRPLPPHHVRPYVRRNKTDRTDAKDLLEANRNEEIQPVPVKTIEQQAIASLHRLRSTWLATRTGRLNTLRGLLREFGIFSRSPRYVVPQVRALVAEPTPVPVLLRTTLGAACDEIQILRDEHAGRRTPARGARVRDGRRDALANRPGRGGDYRDGLARARCRHPALSVRRHFASFLGLTPKEDASGSRRRSRHSKRGDVYVRMLLTHGARLVVWHVKSAARPTPLQQWAVQTEQRRGRNVAAVAVANKLARIARAVWTPQRPFADHHRPE